MFLLNMGGKTPVKKSGSKLFDHEIVIFKYILPRNYECMITVW